MEQEIEYIKKLNALSEKSAFDDLLEQLERSLKEIEILKMRNKKLEKLAADIYTISSKAMEILR